jgi:hypothetical protein
MYVVCCMLYVVCCMQYVVCCMLRPVYVYVSCVCVMYMYVYMCHMSYLRLLRRYLPFRCSAPRWSCLPAPPRRPPPRVCLLPGRRAYEKCDGHRGRGAEVRGQGA